MKENETCCFTGHRPMKLPFGADESHPKCNQLKSILRTEIERLITEHRVCRFITGMALGIDQICAEIVLDLKEKYPQIMPECAIPYEGQATREYLDDKISREQKVRDRPRRLIRTEASSESFSHQEDS